MRALLPAIILSLLIGCVHQQSTSAPAVTQSSISSPSIMRIYLPSAPFISEDIDPIKMGVFQFLRDASKAGDPEGVGIIFEIAVTDSVEGYDYSWIRNWHKATINGISIKDYLDCVTRMHNLEYTVHEDKVIVRRNKDAEPAPRP